MHEQQKSTIQQKIKEMSNKAGLKPPKIKFSNKEKLASTKIFRNEIIVGEYLISQWQKSIFDENDVAASLAHEIGHRIDCNRKTHSVTFKNFPILLFYAAIGLVLIWSCTLLPLPNFWIPALLVFGLWIVFLPWIIIKTEVPIELEADRNAVESNLITAEDLAKSIIKKSSYAQNRKKGPLETFVSLVDMLTHPSTTERLRNLGFEIKKPVEIQRIMRQQTQGG
jgi:hypothetical protein